MQIRSKTKVAYKNQAIHCCGKLLFKNAPKILIGHMIEHKWS